MPWPRPKSVPCKLARPVIFACRQELKLVSPTDDPRSKPEGARENGCQCVPFMSQLLHPCRIVSHVSTGTIVLTMILL